MHLLIPFSSPGPGTAWPADLALPNLSRLLARLAPAQRDEGTAQSWSPPHERALGRSLGWQADDGCLPWAARAAAADGIDTGDQAWGLVTPTHWQVGRDGVVLADPEALALDETASREAFAVLRQLFVSEGLRFEWGAATRWYIAHDALDGLPCASIDRVIGRDMREWLRGDLARHPALRLMRRLQSEAQLLLYPHALNAAREARGVPTLNSFWLSGCGRRQAETATDATVDARLRPSWLAGDAAAWCAAWRALDAGPIGDLCDAARGNAELALTLCGERHAQTFSGRAATHWKRLQRRWHGVAAPSILEAL